jgi:tripartite-type tricarboxylate transporter receptor subunit TctC
VRRYKARRKKQSVEDKAMFGRTTLRRLGALLLGFALLASAAQAQDFPTRPIKVVVGFGPGGLGDLTARLVAQKMSDSMGKPVVIENMPGAGGITAAANVARAAPDGYTMLLVSGQNAASPSLFKSLPYDANKDFAMVSTVGLFDFVVVTNAEGPYKTLQDAMAAARKDPQHFNIGTISAGSVQNLAALLFTKMSGLAVPTVPFKTTGDVVVGLMSGQIQIGFETLPGVIAQIKSGKLRALAVASKEPVPLLPGVPTVAASGVPVFKLVSWNGFVVPAKTPKSVVERLSKEMAKAVAAPDVQAKLKSFGITPHPSTPEQMQAFYDEDFVRWKQVITDAKLGQH